MGLETATYIAGLNESWPDGLDQAATLDNHIRLLKAVLKRQFPGLDGPVSLSSIQVMYLNDVSKSVQYQLNELRDGSATANNAINSRFANSASIAGDARALGGVSASYVAAVSYTNVFAVVQQFGGSPFGGSGTAAVGFTRIFPGNSAAPGYVAFYTADGTRRGYIGFTDGANNLQFAAENGWRFEFSGSLPMYENSPLMYQGGPISASNINSGSIPDARVPLSAVQQHQASLNVNSALTAGSATTATTASNANAVNGYAASEAATGSTVAARNSAGYLFAQYFNQGSGNSENPAVSQIMVTNGGDGFLRKASAAHLGQYLSCQNITGRAGTNKTLASGSGPPSLSGSTNGDLFYYY